MPPQLVFGDRGRQIITVLSLVSLVPPLNAIVMVGTRVLFAMSRDRLIWPGASAINASGTPGVATIVTTFVAVALIATGTFQRLVAMASFFLAANYCVCCLALVVLRRRDVRAGQFRAWGYPWSAAIVVIGAARFRRRFARSPTRPTRWSRWRFWPPVWAAGWSTFPGSGKSGGGLEFFFFMVLPYS